MKLCYGSIAITANDIALLYGIVEYKIVVVDVSYGLRSEKKYIS